MERQEIIKKFLASGHILDESALDMLARDPTLVDYTSQYLSRHSLQQTVTSELIKQLSGTVRVVKSLQPTHRIASPADIAQLLHARYEKMREILSKQLSTETVISINKLSPKIKDFALIATVREIDGNRLVVEDNTGEAIVNIEHEKTKFVVEDEVLGLICEQEQGIMVKKVVWPDIPLDRPINKTKEEIICIFAKDTPQTDYNKLESLLSDKGVYIFVFGEPKQTKNKIFFVTRQSNPSGLPDPSLVEIGEIKILFYSGVEKYSSLWNTTPEIALQNLLKKRHLDPKVEFPNISSENVFFIDEIPDIAVCPTTSTPISVNYKGTTIVSANYPQCIGVNLKTRETFKIDIA